MERKPVWPPYFLLIAIFFITHFSIFPLISSMPYNYEKNRNERLVNFLIKSVNKIEIKQCYK
jgi:hypothetical protein